MWRLAYSSVTAKRFSESELSDLLSACRSRNAADGVTGLLVHVTSPGTGVVAFVQVLEGERSVLDQTYGRIQRDDRHQDLSLLMSAGISARQFGDWTMRREEIPFAELQAVVGQQGDISVARITNVLRDLAALNLVMSRYT